MQSMPFAIFFQRVSRLALLWPQVCRLSVLKLMMAFVISCVSSGCAYRLGVAGRTLPGGYQAVEVPVFANASQEPGLETAFTNFLIQEFERNKVAAVRKRGDAPTTLKGEILSVTYQPTGPIQKGDKAPLLPDGAVLATGYRVLVVTRLQLIEKKSGRILWTSEFDAESAYAAPQVTVARVNTVNPLYNLSTRRRVIEAMARDLMIEAHDRLTENF